MLTGVKKPEPWAMKRTREVWPSKFSHLHHWKHISLFTIMCWLWLLPNRHGTFLRFWMNWSRYTCKCILSWNILEGSPQFSTFYTFGAWKLVLILSDYWKCGKLKWKMTWYSIIWYRLSWCCNQNGKSDNLQIW